MIAALTNYVDHAFIAYFRNILAGYTDELGNPVDFSGDRIRAGYTFDPMDVPEIWVETIPPAQISRNLIGQFFGYAADGTELNALEISQLRTNFGIRTKLPRERSQLFDVLSASVLLAVDPNSVSESSWAQELFTTSGIHAQSVANSEFFVSQTMTPFGQIAEATGTIISIAMLAVGRATTPVTSVTATPEITGQLTFTPR